MGYQVIKQPDDQFAIFSSHTDTIIMWDSTRDEVVDWFVEIEAKRARENAERIVGLVADGEPRRAYFQFTMSWDEALRQDRERGGEAWREFVPQPTEAGDRP